MGEWLSLDLGPGEWAVLPVGLETPERVLLLDDEMARRTAHAAGLTVAGTLRVMLEAREARLRASVRPILDELQTSVMWMPEEVRRRVLRLAGE